jgi:hypothetical protein
MGFDQNDDQPIIHVHRKATRVNLWMVVGVLGFLAAGGLLIWVFVTQSPGP